MGTLAAAPQLSHTTGRRAAGAKAVWRWEIREWANGPSPWHVWPACADEVRLAWQPAGQDTLTLGLGEAWRTGPEGLSDLIAVLERHPGLVALGSPGWPDDGRRTGGWLVPEWIWEGRPDGVGGTWRWQGRAAVELGPEESDSLWKDAVRRLSGAVVSQVPPDGPEWRRPHALQGRDRFVAGARRALTLLAGDGLAKVVLSRDVTLVPTTGFADPWAVFRGMLARAADSHRMAWQEPGGVTWVAASPETFCRWQGARFEVEAMAGTAARHADLGPLDRPPALREQALVQEGILRRLAAIARNVTAEPPSPVAWQGLQHLRSHITGLLVEGHGPDGLVAALHPTAAVGGWPEQDAMALIPWLEGRSRGLYGAPFGKLTAAEGHLAVWLRGACLDGSSARVTVGAGLVRGSSPEGEWAETEAKLAATWRVLGQGH